MRMALLLVAALVYGMGGSMMGEQSRSSGSAFRYEVAKDPESGWSVYTLSYRDPAGGRSLAARIVPEAGSNLISLEVDGTEILHGPPKIAEARGFRYGNPILYPTPNRVRDSRLTFEGKTLQFQANNGPNFLHGLVHSVPWRAETPVETAAGIRLRTTLDFDEGFEGYQRFPIKNRISVSYTLGRDGIAIDFEVENRDAQKLPFGLALHPYFKILGERAQTFIRVPATHHMEAVDLLPTGRLEPLEGSRFDLRAYTSLQALDLDDVFFGMATNRPAGYEARDRKLQVVLEASDVFTHAVVYTPPGRPFFCIENQTCSTDAHNLHARGLAREAHLTVLPPGGRIGGRVVFTIRRL